MEACKYSLENKASYREVSEKFGVPQSTLRDKLHTVERLNVGSPPAKKPKLDPIDTSTVESPVATVVSPQISDSGSDQDKMVDVSISRVVNDSIHFIYWYNKER